MLHHFVVHPVMMHALVFHGACLLRRRDNDGGKGSQHDRKFLHHLLHVKLVTSKNPDWDRLFQTPELFCPERSFCSAVGAIRAPGMDAGCSTFEFACSAHVVMSIASLSRCSSQTWIGRVTTTERVVSDRSSLSPPHLAA